MKGGADKIWRGDVREGEGKIWEDRERNHGEKNSGIEQRGVYAVKERKGRRRGEGMEEWTMGT